MERARGQHLNIADKWWVMIAVTFGMFMSLMDSTIVNVAIPQMQREFGANINNIQWVTTIYMITQAAVIPTAPYLTNRFGGKRAYIWSLAAFLAASVLCGFAWNLPSLIAFRLIQGIGGGTLLPMVMTLLYQAFPISERGKAVSAMGVPLMVAPLLGPVLGGYLVTYFGWPWAFFINIPLGVMALIIAQKALKPSVKTHRPRFDQLGFLTIAAGSAALLYGISAVTERSSAAVNVGFLVGGLLLLSAFIFIEVDGVRRGREVLLDLRRFADRTFSLSNLTNVLVFFTRFGILFLVPIYLQTLRQHSAVEAGGFLAVQALATMSVLPLAGKFADRIGPRSVVLVGLMLLAGGSALLLTLSLTTPVWVILGVLIVLGVSFGLTQQIPVAAMSRINKHESAEIANGSTLVSVLQATAAPMGVAVLSSIVQARSPHYIPILAAQGLEGSQLQQQSVLLAMHESFGLALGLILASLIVMSFVPNRRSPKVKQEELLPVAEA